MTGNSLPDICRAVAAVAHTASPLSRAMVAIRLPLRQCRSVITSQLDHCFCHLQCHSHSVSACEPVTCTGARSPCTMHDCPADWGSGESASLVGQSCVGRPFARERDAEVPTDVQPLSLHLDVGPSGTQHACVLSYARVHLPQYFRAARQAHAALCGQAHARGQAFSGICVRFSRLSRRGLHLQRAGRAESGLGAQGRVPGYQAGQSACARGR